MNWRYVTYFYLFFSRYELKYTFTISSNIFDIQNIRKMNSSRGA